jgi:UDP-N-acetyl-2-amino-2-deoxyglucuronate dehydrogenase
MLHRRGEGVEYVSICSPNHLHDAHIRLSLRNGAHVVCEKPVVIKPWNIAPLQELETESGLSVNVVLQVRLHPIIQELSKRMQTGFHELDLTYVTPRGIWYDISWKGDVEKSGGIVTNIGIHLFDLMLWMFGPATDVSISEHSNRHLRGTLTLERARARWLLSTRTEDLPGRSMERSRQMVVDGETVDFTTGFEELHTRVYEEVLAGRGFTLADAYPAVELTERIRNLINGGGYGRNA